MLKKSDYYKAGYSDALNLAIGLVSLVLIFALNTVNFSALWPLFVPAICLGIAFLDTIIFNISQEARFRNVWVLGASMIYHGVALMCSLVVISLLVTNPSSFLSSDCQDCTIDWNQRDDDICEDAYEACRGVSKERTIVFALFSTLAFGFVLELMRTLSIVMLFLAVMRSRNVYKN